MLNQNVVEKSGLPVDLIGENENGVFSIEENEPFNSTIEWSNPPKFKKYFRAQYLPDEFVTKDAPGLKTAELRKRYIKYIIFDLMNSFTQYRFTEISFVDRKGKRRNHSPFMKVTYRKDISPAMYWKPKIVEVWSREEIFANWEWFPQYYRNLRRYARNKGCNFVLITDSFFDSEFFANVEFLVSYLNLPIDAESNKRSYGLIKGLRELGEIQIKCLLDYVSNDEIDRQKNKLILWNLLLSRRILTEYFLKISDDSKVWLEN